MNHSSAHNSMLYPQHMHHLGAWLPPQYQMEYPLPPANRFVYVKQNFIQPLPQPEVCSSTVHINPNFKKKVFVNPNFQRNVGQASVMPKIHINPNSHKINIGKKSNSDTIANVTKIHINPNILRTIPIPVASNSSGSESCKPINKIVYSSRTKLIRNPDKSSSVSSTPKTRRKSICSKYKIIKSHLLKKKFIYNDLKMKTKLISPAKYILTKMKLSPMKKNSHYKLDNRLSKKISIFKKISSLNKRKSKINQLKYKTNNLVRIDNVLYRKSLHSLRKTSDAKKVKNNKISKHQLKIISESKYKLVRNKSLVKERSNGQSDLGLRNSSSKTKLRLRKVKKTASPGKLKKCNIPCYIYRKFGRCKASEIGKCFRKHDPDQVALCTKFLQGACLNEKCLLSHNVSPEKMPTCKYYLEGTCSKDQCPYLHVRISPKADICKDFLEGFCKMANKCDKRHQFLCPDFEKHGKCLKQRCPYPHGRMVRKYSVFHRDKFAKKSSDKQSNVVNSARHEQKIVVGQEEIPKCDDDDEIAIKTRYYVESKSGSVEKMNAKHIVENQLDLQSRPKLGILPSFIAFEDS